MDCREFQELIPVFLDNKLNRKQAIKFFEHMEQCSDCKEELRIQFLISEGLIRLEDGTSFDLNNELDRRIEVTLKRLKNKTITNIIIYGLEVIGILAVIFILFLVFTKNII